MKIFFHASIYGKRFYEKQYKTIVEICESNKNQVYSDHILKRNYRDTDKFSREDHERDFRKITDEIKKSDAVIVEGTYPSIGTGHYMTIALSYLKPVLVLYQKNPHGVLVGNPNRLLFLEKYNIKDLDKLKKKIARFMLLAKKKTLKNRFNLMLDDEMVEFLDIQAKKLNLSKADLIRQMISEKAKG